MVNSINTHLRLIIRPQPPAQHDFFVFTKQNLSQEYIFCPITMVLTKTRVLLYIS